MEQRRALISTLIALIIMIVPASALTTTTPADDEHTLNQQPLFSWTDHAGAFKDYTLTISGNPDLSEPWAEFTTTKPYHQLQKPLSPGTWYWQARTNGGEENDTTTTATLVILSKPSFNILPDTSRYEEDGRVVFRIDAPKGTAVDMSITKQGFSLPFVTDDLQTETFTTFLEPGTYTITTTFTFEGTTTEHADILTLRAPAPGKRTLRFNVTDSDEEPLRGATITLVSEAETIERSTNAQGSAEVLAEEGRYDISITKDGYFGDGFTKNINDDEHFRIRLAPEEAATRREPLSLASVSTIKKPRVSIKEPSPRQSVKQKPLLLTYEATEAATIDECDLLTKTEEQQGWTITDSDEGQGSLSYQDPSQGTLMLKVQCSLKGSTATVTSDTRTVIVDITPDHHDGIQAFNEELSDLRVGKASSDPLYLSLGVSETVENAKSTLQNLEDDYLQHLSEGRKAQAEEVDEEIEEAIRSAKEEIITSFTITEREEEVTEVDLDAAKTMIRQWTADAELTDKKKQSLRERLLEEQADYTIRTSTVVAKVETLSGNERYLTGVTRSLQMYFDDERPKEVVVTEELPSYFLQQTGTPKVLDAGGSEAARLQDERLVVRLLPEESYTLLFSGNVKPAAASLDSLFVRRHENVSGYLEEDGGDSGISGMVTGVLEGAGTLSPVVWVLIAVAIAAVIAKPFSGISFAGDGRDVQRLTESIHDTLDLMEQGMHQEAFANYPSIIDSYERLSAASQESLSFAITNLSSALHVYTVDQSITNTLMRLNNLSSRDELAQVQAMTAQLIEDYKELDRQGREGLRPRLLALQRGLRDKHALLTSPKPARNHPLP